jgi:hypothetical protein
MEPEKCSEMRWMFEAPPWDTLFVPLRRIAGVGVDDVLTGKYPWQRQRVQAASRACPVRESRRRYHSARRITRTAGARPRASPGPGHDMRQCSHRSMGYERLPPDPVPALQ